MSIFLFVSTTFIIESFDFVTTVFALSVAIEKAFPTFLALSLRFSLNDFVLSDSFVSMERSRKTVRLQI